MKRGVVVPILQNLRQLPYAGCVLDVATITIVKLPCIYDRPILVKLAVAY
jgi:hypothetical protein